MYLLYKFQPRFSREEGEGRSLYTLDTLRRPFNTRLRLCYSSTPFKDQSDRDTKVSVSDVEPALLTGSNRNSDCEVYPVRSCMIVQFPGLSPPDDGGLVSRWTWTEFLVNIR